MKQLGEDRVNAGLGRAPANRERRLVGVGFGGSQHESGKGERLNGGLKQGSQASNSPSGSRILNT